MDEFIDRTMNYVKKYKNNDEALISMLVRDVYLNDIIYMKCCKCKGHWKEYKKLEWNNMGMPIDFKRKIQNLTTLIQEICERMLLCSNASDDSKRNATIIALMRVNQKISSENYDLKSIIERSKRLFQVKCDNHT